MAEIPHLDLDAVEVDETEHEPACTFTLGGREWSCRQGDDVPFDVVAKLFGAVDDERRALVSIEPFFRGVLEPEQVDEFIEMLHSAESPITLRNIRPLIEHVASNVLGRPTGRPGRYAPGSPNKARTSAVV